MIFVSGSPGFCAPPSTTGEDGFEYNLSHPQKVRYNVIANAQLLNESTDLVRHLTIPFAQDGLATTTLYKDASEMRADLRGLRSSKGLLEEVLNFYRPEAYMFDETLNAGYYDKRFNVLRRFFFAPAADLPNFENDILRQLKSEISNHLHTPLADPEVQSSSENNCAEVCLARWTVATSEIGSAYRLRLYSGGGIYDDHITVQDASGDTVATLYLLNNRLSHYLVISPGQRKLFDANGDLVEVLTVEKIERPVAKSTTWSAVPVLVFEGYSDSRVDENVAYGPYMDSHYFGWFKKTDRRPFYLGRDLSRPSEESMPDASHGFTVTRLSSGDFTGPVIPFFPDQLWTDDMTTFFANFKGRFIANISTANVMTRAACAASPIAETIAETADRGVWVVGAGNSGREGSIEKSLNCPQNLIGPNMLKVASSSDGERIAPSSTYGENFVDIVANGCPAGEETCRTAGTSFAAPRVAAALSRLTNKFINTSPSELRLAALLTARVPTKGYWVSNSFLAVRSGGFFDAEAMELFLTSDPSKSLEDRMIEAKANQYSDLRTSTIRQLVREQIQRFKKLEVLK